ncbi:MAG: RES family NAD+ phosphorylase, partial [Ktedonobacterales bacterium]
PDGTCYVAESQLGAFVERFQDFLAIPFTVIHGSKIASLRLPRPLRLADCTVSQARRLGMTGEIHTFASRDITQAWASAFSRDGYDGIRYFARHDPSMKRKSIAIFGAAGEANWPVVRDRRIDKRLIQRAKAVFGIKVLDILP